MSDRTHDTQPDSPGQPNEAFESSELDQSLQALHLAKDQALLNPDIMASVFSHIPSSDSETVARMTEVNRQWWHVGHRFLWREGFNQLSGLLLDVDDPARREYFASLIKTIHFKDHEPILAAGSALQTLKFPRLEAIYINATNLFGVKAENLDALMVPSLRSFHVQRYPLTWEQFRADRIWDTESNAERDIEIFLSVLFSHSSITTLTVDFYNYFPGSLRLERLLLDYLDDAEQLEHLELNRLSLEFTDRWSPDVLLQRLLQHKPNLKSFCFPLDLHITERHVEDFLSRVGLDWSLPSLKAITLGPEYTGRRLFSQSNAPRFYTAQPAARLLDRMPNLEEAALVFWTQNTFADTLVCVFDSLSKMKHLRKLDMECVIWEADWKGEWLTQLATLSELESVRLVDVLPRSVLITGAQMVHFLTSLPKLKKLELTFGDWPVYCSAEEKATIEEALGKLDSVKLLNLTFEVRDTIETED